ncbi:hypothetical protein JOM56_000179 [Amanita muscaria]
MSPSRFSPAARLLPPETTPWPTLATPTGSNTVPDPNDGTNTRRGSSPSRSSPRKMKGRHRQDRPAEEDIKFNVGPKSPRSMLARRFMRRTRPERVIDPYTMDVPNYPPPSFQEAMSDSPVPVSPTAPTMPPQGEGTTTTQAQEPDARPNDQENVHINLQRASATFDSDSGSDEFVNVPGTRDDVLRDPRQEIGNEQEMETESQGSLTFPSSLSRGRRGARDVVDDDDQAEEEEVEQVAATTRRHNSLSPLRTLFPSLHFTLHDRAASATEPASPPYRSMSFFRSTTSLGLASGSTTPTLKSKSSVNNLAQHPASKRGLLTQSKRKDRPERPEKSEIDPQTDKLDAWEVIDSVEAKQAPAAPEPTMKDRKKLEKMMAKRSREKREKRDVDRISPVSEDVPAPEPFRGQLDNAPTTPPPTSPVSAEMEIPAPAPPQTQTQPQTEQPRPSQTLPQPQIEQPRPQRQPTVYPIDRKAHIPFIERVPPRPAPQTPPPQPISPPATPPRATQSHEHPLHPTTPVKSHNGGPQVTTVRHRQTNGPLQPLITQRSQVFNASPLANQWQADEISPAVAIGTGSEAAFDPIYESALETPLPPSPADSIGNISRSGTPRKAGYSNEYRSAIADMAGLQFTLSTDSFATAPDTAPWAESPMKKHYPGRPLPVAPGPHGVGGARMPMEQRYIPLTPPPDSEKNRERRGEEEVGKGGKGRRNNCPEALLIDLDDNTFVSGVNTPVAATSQVDLRVLSAPSTPGLPAAGFPMIGYGHGHGHGHGHQCGHLATASMSTPNLTQPIFPTSLHVMSMTPNQNQVHSGAAPGPPVWPPLYAIPPEPRWLCSCGVDHDHETAKYWSRSPMPSPMAKEIHVVPCALGLSRAQTHPPAPLGQMCVMPQSLHVNGR